MNDFERVAKIQPIIDDQRVGNDDSASRLHLPPGFFRIALSEPQLDKRFLSFKRLLDVKAEKDDVGKRLFARIVRREFVGKRRLFDGDRQELHRVDRRQFLHLVDYFRTQSVR